MCKFVSDGTVLILTGTNAARASLAISYVSLESLKTTGNDWLVESQEAF